MSEKRSKITNIKKTAKAHAAQISSHLGKLGAKNMGPPNKCKI